MAGTILLDDKSHLKYTTAINKAINNLEVPVKQKHVRSAIIGTFQEQGAQTFWMVALRLPYLEDRIVAWKLCHVVHKVLREGHPLCLVHSQRHRKELNESGKLWAHLKEGYGRMIRLYTNLLLTKLDFHRRNPRFPGHLGVTQDELDSIGANDINNYFQLSVEMFDYIDNILELQQAIFGSLDMSRSNSMTSAGQCRLAPLIMCIQDAARLYDYCVKILFRLHASLPADLLQGHRDRFLHQFKGLKLFYQNTNALQYFRNLISVTLLPEKPPNFLREAELGTYVTQEVVVPPEEDELVEGNLIDTSEVSFDLADNHSQQSVSPPPPQQHPATLQLHIEAIADRDNLIKHLQYELERLRHENHRIDHENSQTSNKLHEEINALEISLATKESELMQERQLKDDLFHQASAVAQTQDIEQKNKEKLSKIAGVYQKLREQHISLLREKAEVDKKFKDSSSKYMQSEQQILELQSRITSLELDSKIKTESLQQASDSKNEELESLRRDKDLFNMETEVLKKSLEDVMAEKLKISKDMEEQILFLQSRITSLELDSKIKTESLQQASDSKNEELESLRRDKDLFKMETEVLKKSLEDVMAEKSKIYKDMEEQILLLQSRITSLELDSKIKTESMQQASDSKNEELELLRRDKDLFKMETEVLKKSLEEVMTEKSNILKEIEKQKLQEQNLQKRLAELTLNIAEAESSLQQIKKDHSDQVLVIITKAVEEGKNIVQFSIHELGNPALSAVSCSPDYFRSLTSEAQNALNAAIGVTHQDPTTVVVLSSRIAHRFATYLLQGRATSNTSPDIIFGERMAESCKQLGESVLKVLDAMQSNQPTQEPVARAIENLKTVAALGETLSGSLKGESAEKLADMIDDELAEMDKAIEEAARRIQEMLSKTRAEYSGIKLEVNQKILDSCTTLMQAIKILVQKARLLQAEIVSQGKGTSSAKEFYKRNHRWTDGFISAAKAVAVAAKFFLSAADKVVTGQGKLEQLVVASQEIAASTAQLVVASRVKADRHSTNLQQLSTASKGVTNATGGVVATVKDCSSLMDEAEELDVTNMTLHQAKRLEMEAQVRVLELEKELEQERLRFSALRRHHYQLAGEGEGWEVQNNHNK